METLSAPQPFKNAIPDLTTLPQSEPFTALNNREPLRRPFVPQSGSASAAVHRVCDWKRNLDLLSIIVASPLWLPLMLLIMGWIKAVSPGPIFYRQERVGYKGKRFTIFKFRSMRVNVETAIHERHVASLIESDAPMKKLDAGGDLRLVPMGAIIRAAGLDELPQIFNPSRRDEPGGPSTLHLTGVSKSSELARSSHQRAAWTHWLLAGEWQKQYYLQSNDRDGHVLRP